MNRLDYLEAVIGLVARDVLGDLGWTGDDPPMAGIHCGDTFYWACADLEVILPEDLPRLTEILTEADAWNREHKAQPYYNGELVWMAEKRQMRPIKPIFDSLTGPTREAIERWPERVHGGDECFFCTPDKPCAA